MHISNEALKVVYYDKVLTAAFGLFFTSNTYLSYFF